MRIKIYNFLVNKQPGIRVRYHNMHENSTGAKKIFSWIYLLWLNFAYYILFSKFLGQEPRSIIYEEKRLLVSTQESNTSLEISKFVQELSGYEYISFDIFDTLILRPFSEPTDLFYFIGQKLGYMDFKHIRAKAELETRKKKYSEKKTYEVTLEDIWNLLEEKTGLSAEKGMALELETEMQFCYANPFMSEVYHQLLAMGKKIFIVSDMYLPAAFLTDMLKKNGYDGFEKLYVSCEYDKNKGTGELFRLVKKEYGIADGQMIHIGDNVRGDVQMPKEVNLESLYYPNVNKDSKKYRAYDMSPIIGGAYRGVVNNHLYSGIYKDTMEYEYGYVYGGLFVTGYCSFIHDYCQKNHVEKVLFLSRDGDILSQVYNQLYPNENTEYVYWSRKVSTKLMASSDRYDYLRRFLSHKVNQNVSLQKIFESMELEDMLSLLPENLSAKDVLTSSNIKMVKAFLLEHWNDVTKVYESEQNAAKTYYARVLEGCSKVVAVDIGWAGSGAIALNHLVNQVWELSCEVIGLLAGTNTLHNTEPDTSETFLQSGQLVSYLYSMSHNRDLMKKHDLNKDYNVFWEILLSSPNPQFIGFGWMDENQTEVKFRFGDVDANQEGIKEVQKGILQFAADYMEHFGDIPYMMNISGRDAYAPMLVAASRNEKYLKAMRDRFHLIVGVE